MSVILDKTIWASPKEYRYQEQYTSGELRSTGFYGYGCYEVEMKPVAHPGVTTAFFTFSGPNDSPDGVPRLHNEINIQFLGKDMKSFQTRYWTNDDASDGHDATTIQLDYQANKEFHKYGFKWSESSIEWYVDRKLVHTSKGSAAYPIPNPNDTTHRIMMNMWPTDDTNEFKELGHPLTAKYRNFIFGSGQDCKIGDSKALSATDEKSTSIGIWMGGSMLPTISTTDVSISLSEVITLCFVLLLVSYMYLTYIKGSVCARKASLKVQMMTPKRPKDAIHVV